MKNENTSRTELLLGSEKIECLAKAHLLIVGLGGVGGMVLEMLARSGIGAFTLVDGDCISPSNINRQILANTANIGAGKVEEARKRVSLINPEARINVIHQFVEEDHINSLFSESFDFVIDCIDTVRPKCALIQETLRRKIPIISSMGAGAKIDPSRIKIADISKTQNCSLARVVRRALSAKGIKKGVPVVYSTESPIATAVQKGSLEKGKNTTVGTISYLPNIFGCFMAAYVIEHL